MTKADRLLATQRLYDRLLPKYSPVIDGKALQQIVGVRRPSTVIDTDACRVSRQRYSLYRVAEQIVLLG